MKSVLKTDHQLEPSDGSNRIRYPMIDVFRIVCACLIVFLHCLEVKTQHPFAHMIVECFAQQAVPFFFIVSGFFFAKKVYAADNQIAAILQYTKKQLLLYAAWMLIELPSMIIGYHNLYAEKSVLYITLVIIRRILFAGQGVYWYLLALAESCLIAGILIKFKKEKLLYVLSVIGLLLGFIYDADISFLFFGKVNNIFYNIFSWSNNFIMKGLPYVSIGVFFARNAEKFPKKNTLVATYAVVGIINVLFFAAIYQNHLNWVNFMILYPLQAQLLFMIGILPSKNEISRETCDVLRGMSSTIYFIHATIIYDIVDQIWPVDSPVLFKFSITLALSLAIYWLVKKTKFKPLCWLFSLKA